MTPWFIICYVLHLAKALTIPAKSVQPVVDLGYAIYEGTRQSDGVNSWLSLRFAAAPLGDLRWRAPQAPPTDRSRTQSAHEFGAKCIGMIGASDPLSATVIEDCLFINVWAPANLTTESKLPVWFFIGGGGYAENVDMDFNGTDLIKGSNNSVIFAQINYRVGAFGFLAAEDVRADGDLNVGLLDQRRAMHWVQDYIHLYFAGTPGCLQPQNLSSMACLRSKSSAELQSADIDLRYPMAPGKGDWTWLPVVDGTLCDGSLYDAFQQGRFVQVPMLVGDDTNEGTLFVRNNTNVTAFKDNLKDYYPVLSETDLETIVTAHPEDAFPPSLTRPQYFPATAAAYGEATFICPGLAISRAASSQSSGTAVGAASWNYRFNVAVPRFVASGLGVYHTSDDPAIFGPDYEDNCQSCGYGPLNVNIVPVDMHYWLSFVRSLDPNTYRWPGSPYWQPFAGDGTPGGPPHVRRLVTSHMETVPDSELQRCALWERLHDIIQQ